MQSDNKDILELSAIAIKDGDGDAPAITAKGKGYVADRILDIAFAEGVKVRQDKDLTNLLEAFDVDSPIPLEALHTVGLILERVYQENRRLQTSPIKPAKSRDPKPESPDLKPLSPPARGSIAHDD